MRTRFFVAGSLLVVGMFAIVQAQPGGFRGGFGGGGPAGLVTIKAVQEELKMTEEQVTKVTEWAKEFGPKSVEIMKDKGVEFGKGGGKGGFTDEMREKMAEANAEISKVAYKELGDVLKADQVARLKQLETRRMGVNAFSNATVAAALKLTDSQKTSVKGIVGDFQKESREIRTEAGGADKGKGKGKGKGGFGGFGVSPETQAKIAKVEKEAIGKVVDLFEDSQKKTWKEMIGADFDSSKLVQTFGGGFGGKGKNKKKDE